MYGGDAHLSSAQLTLLKNGWRLIAAAPNVDPSRFAGSLTSNPAMRSFVGEDTGGSLGNSSALATTFASVSSLSDPLNGVTPYRSSKMNTPRVHQSTVLPWPSPDHAELDRVS